MLKEINGRESDGISVTLLWEDSTKTNPTKPEFEVRVVDSKRGEDFAIQCDTFPQAKSAYYHPFAVANSALKSGRIAA